MGTVLFAQNNVLFMGAEVSLDAKSSKLDVKQESQTAELIRKGGLLLVKGTVNKDQEGWFILDTGSPGLLLNDPSVRGSESDGVISGATGVTHFQEKKLKHLQLAGLTQKNVEALALDLSFLEDHLKMELIGIIGFEQLKDYPVHVSLANNTLGFGESNTSAIANKVQRRYDFKLTAHLPILEANVGGQSLEFVFDTGSGVNVIDQAYFDSLEDHLRGRPTTRTLAGIDNNPTEVPCALVRLTLLEQEEHTDRPFLFANLEEVQLEAPNVAGLLGPAFWKCQSFTIDYQRNQLIAYK